MDHPECAGSKRADLVEFDRQVHVEFRGAQLSSDGGLLVMRELDDALGMSDLAAKVQRDTRRGKNTVHQLDGLFRQSVFGRLAGYEDVNDADRLALDPVTRQIVGGRGGRHRPDGARHTRRHPPIASACAMRMTGIEAQTERKRQDRSARCAENHHHRSTTRRLRGLIHPAPEACVFAYATRGKNACPAVGFRRSWRQKAPHLGNVG